jgi:hypothetical protein
MQIASELCAQQGASLAISNVELLTFSLRFEPDKFRTELPIPKHHPQHPILTSQTSMPRSVTAILFVRFPFCLPSWSTLGALPGDDLPGTQVTPSLGAAPLSLASFTHSASMAPKDLLVPVSCWCAFGLSRRGTCAPVAPYGAHGRYSGHAAGNSDEAKLSYAQALAGSRGANSLYKG